MDSDQKREPQLVFVDGRDSLATVIVKRRPGDGGVVIEAFVRGISKAQGAAIMRHEQWASEAREEEREAGNAN